MVADGTVSRSAEVCGWFFKNINRKKHLPAMMPS